MSSASAGLRAELENIQRLLKEEESDNCSLRNEIAVANAEIQELQVISYWYNKLNTCLILFYRLEDPFTPGRNSKKTVAQYRSRTQRQYQSFLSCPLRHPFR